METPLRILVISCLVLVVWTFDIPKECLVSSKWEGKWPGKNMTLTSWMASEEEDRETKMSVPHLTLKLMNQKRPPEYDLVELWKSNASLTRWRDNEGTVTWVKYQEELRVGWVDLYLDVSGSDLDVLHLFDSKLLSDVKPLEYENVTVTGTYVTVNCHQPFIGWSLKENGGTSVIPISREQIRGEHLFLFSQNFTRPVLSFSSTSSSLRLAWNGTSIYGIPGSSLELQQNPLPPFVQHFLTLFCRTEEVGVICDILAGKEQMKVWTVELDSLPEDLIVTTSMEEQMYIFIDRESTMMMTEFMAAEQKGTEVVREMSGGQIASLVIIGLVLVSIISLVVVSSIHHDKIVGKQEIRPSFANLFSKVEEGEEEIPFIPYHESPRLLPRGSVIMEEQNLWEAVDRGDVEAVKSLLAQGYHPDDVELERFTTPFMDAHMLGSKDIVLVFADYKGEKYTTAPDDLIKTISYELEKSMKDIFLAAEFGMYEHERGVEALLKTYRLPATITDSQGRSILHYMASVTAMDSIPVWQPKDIRKFFANHEFFPNAVDHRGRTALHELSQHPQDAEADVIWDGREWELADAWLAMARLLVSCGCDPRIPNHKGQRPHQLAHEAGNFELAKFLDQKCADLGNINPEKGIDKFDDLIAAVKRGDTSQMVKLLLQHVPLLPVSANADPLVEALRLHQRDAVFLLLSAGASLCNRSIGDMTPLEVAHNTLGSPACSPALLRKAFCERMEDEIARVSQEEENLKSLRQCMTAYNLQVMDVGSKARWIFPAKEDTDRCREAKRLLIQASELGLSLTCQLLGLENFYLHSLPGESNAFHKTAEGHHVNTQLVLYRELGMSPFILDSSEDLCWDLLEDLWVHELKALENLCQMESNKEVRLRLENDLTKLRRLRNGSNLVQEDVSENSMDLLLYALAKHGLVTILHVVLSHFEHLDVNKVVKSCCSYTMVHVAAASGRMNVLEYLLHQETALDVLCVGNYTPAHIAAVTGHRKCFEYLMDYMKSSGININPKCYIGLNATEMMTKYEELCSDDSFPLLPHEATLLIRNEKDEQTQAYETLHRRGTILNISTPDNLFQNARTKACKRIDMEDIERLIQTEVQSLGKLIDESGYQGKIIPVGAFHDGHEFFNVNHVDFIYEVSDMGTHENVSYEDIEEEERITIDIESDAENSVYSGSTFVNLFLQRVQNLLVKFEPTSSCISLVPPYIDRSSEGVRLFWILSIKQQIKFVRTLLMPVLPVTCPLDDVNHSLPSDLLEYTDAKSDIPLHLTNDCGEWIYSSIAFERTTFQNLSKNQRTVWITCLLLRRLLQSTWWSPSFNYRNHTKQWHTLSLGFPLLPERGLRSLFLEELVESQGWSKQHLFERVISVFSRACKRDLREQWVPKEYINSFVTPRHFCCRVRESMCGVLQYLEELAQAEPQVPDKTVKFAEP